MDVRGVYGTRCLSSSAQFNTTCIAVAGLSVSGPTLKRRNRFPSADTSQLRSGAELSYSKRDDLIRSEASAVGHGHGEIVMLVAGWWLLYMSRQMYRSTEITAAPAASARSTRPPNDSNCAPAAAPSSISS